MDDPPPTANPNSNQPKSKLDTLSREDLIRFLKKQVENTKESKQEVARLSQALDETKKAENDIAAKLTIAVEEKSILNRRIEELEAKQEFLKQSVTGEKDDVTASELILKARVAELEQEHSSLQSEKQNWEKQRGRLSEDLEAARSLTDELRSQLDDARAESAALREKRAVADVFSLEIKDYEKKVDQLQKELKDTAERLSDCLTESESLRCSLSESKKTESVLTEERAEARQSVEELRKELYEEKVQNEQVSSELSRVKESLSMLQDDRGSERMGLGRELAAGQQRVLVLEEAVEALREENARLRTDRDAADARAEDLSKDYESFKSRARFVLEQKAKTDADTDSTKEETQVLETTISQLRESIESMKVKESTLHDDLHRLREQNARLDRESRTDRRCTEEAEITLDTTMDELRVARAELERSIADSRRLVVRLEEMEQQSRDVSAAKDKIEAILLAERATSENQIQNLTKSLSEERHRREQALLQLDEYRREQQQRSAITTVTRPPPAIAAVFPQFAERDICVSEPGGAAHSGISEKFATDDATQHERSLEEVLFGEDSAGVSQMNDLMGGQMGPSLDEVIAELELVRKQAQNTMELLNESEAANGRLQEQSHLLKEEIRRLERNQERTSHIENTEYLKNVIIKFLTPERVSAEKGQLIPILNTMLRLSSDEVNILQRAASQQGAAAESSSDSQNASWGTYLRWGGLS